MEAAGVALALLPLMVNQLDNYVEGLQTLKTFQTKSYRAYLERCAAMLGGQHAILMNTLGRALGDLPVAEISDLLSDPNSIRWTNPRLEDALRPNLGSIIRFSWP